MRVASKLTEADFNTTQNGDNQNAPPVSINSEEEKLEKLYELVAWPLGRQYGHPYDAFKLIIACVDPQYTSLFLYCNFRTAIQRACLDPYQCSRLRPSFDR